ncbi:MAG: AAA family ATPase [Pseudomonadota bacterium]
MSLDTVLKDGPLAINDEDLRARVGARRSNRGLSQNATAAEIGISPSVLSQWMDRKYRGDNDAVDRKVTAWLDGERAKDELAKHRPTEPGFLATPIGNRITSVLNLAHHSPDMAVIAGAPGVGKTMAAREYMARHNNVHLVTMDPEMTSPNRLLAEVMHVIGLPEKSPTQMRYKLEEHLRNTRSLLIIDEAQHLQPKALDMARSLHDRMEIGVVLMGNHGFFAATKSQSRTDGFAQFFSRVGARVRIDAPTEKDIDVVLDGWGVSDAKSRKVLHDVASKMWALRGLKKTMHAAADLAASEGSEMTATHIRQAWATLNHFDG